ADTYIRGGSPNSNQGSSLILRLQQSGPNRALIAFDSAALVQAVGSDSVASATLQLTIASAGDNWGTTGRSIELHRLTHSWTEAGATWNCAVDAVPTNNSADCSGSTAWVMGTPDSLHPWNSVVSASAVITTSETGQVALDVTTDVRSMVAGGSSRGWILMKSDETVPGSVDFASRESQTPPQLVITLISSGATVPSTAPDTVPAGYYSYSNLVQNPDSFPGLFYRDIVSIFFQATASQPQRQAAIDAIGGSVIGGVRFGTTDGLYLVRLPHDSTNNRVFGATDQLRGMSSVAVAGPDAVDTAILLYRRPNDGASWQKSNWRLSPDSAFSAPGAPIADNWGPEAVAGPLAWGCSVGDSSTHIGIIDAGFHHAADVDANVDPANADFDVPGEDGTSHGTQVASVLAARGNNGTGITGMMWNAKLHLVDAVARDAQGNPIVSPTGIPAYDR